MNDLRNLMPGDRVKVFDSSLFKDDKTTPLSMTMKSATIVKRYGQIARHYPINDFTLGPYEDMVDVVFDHKPERVSHGHFTWGVESNLREEENHGSKKERSEVSSSDALNSHLSGRSESFSDERPEVSGQQVVPQAREESADSSGTAEEAKGSS